MAAAARQTKNRHGQLFREIKNYFLDQEFSYHQGPCVVEIAQSLSGSKRHDGGLGQPLAKAVNSTKFAFLGRHHQLLFSYSICLRTNQRRLFALHAQGSEWLSCINAAI